MGLVTRHTNGISSTKQRSSSSTWVGGSGGTGVPMPVLGTLRQRCTSSRWQQQQQVPGGGMACHPLWTLLWQQGMGHTPGTDLGGGVCREWGRWGAMQEVMGDREVLMA